MRSRMRLGAVLIVGMFSIACAHLPAGHGEGIRLRCELDGHAKRLPREIRITLRDSGDTLAVPVHRGSLTWPDPVLNEWVDVSIDCAGRRMEIQEVKLTMRSGMLTVGIDTPPFENEWMLDQKHSNLVEIRYARNQPATGLGSIWAEGILDHTSGGRR